MDQLPRLGKRELICLLLFTCNYVVSVWRGFPFLWMLGMGNVILLWHSLSLLLIIFQYMLSNWPPNFLKLWQSVIILTTCGSHVLHIRRLATNPDLRMRTCMLSCYILVIKLSIFLFGSKFLYSNNFDPVGGPHEIKLSPYCKREAN